MSNKLLFFLLFISFPKLFGQKIEIELKSFPTETTERKFYISKVLDSRNDTTKIGWSVIDKNTRGRYFTLKGGVGNAIYHYISCNLKQDTNQTPLVLNLISLVLTEHTKGMREGKAKIVVQFLKEDNSTFGKVYETSAYTESTSEFGKDIYMTHERRIRAVLGQCIKNLSESKWMETKPDFVSMAELKDESSKLDTVSKSLADTAGLLARKRKEDLVLVQLNQIAFTGGIIPKITLDNRIHHSLWAFKKHFEQLNDLKTNKLYADYKGKFKLTFLALGLGAVFIAASFTDQTVQDTGLPNLGLAVSGLAFAACSIPIYIKTNILGRKTVQEYNVAIENK